MSKVIAFVEHTDAVDGFSGHMVFYESTDGITWTLQQDLHDPVNIWLGNLVPISGGGVIGGNVPQTSNSGTYNAIPRSNDQGTTWASTLSPALDVNTDSWDIRGAADFGNNVWLAAGTWNTNGFSDSNLLMRSTDNAVTFQTFTPTSYPWNQFSQAVAIASFGNGIGLLTDDTASTIFRTTDSGQNWSSVTLPGSDTRRASYFVICEGGVALAVGSYFTGGETRPTLWRTTDSGATWTRQVDPFGALSYPAANPALGGGQKQKEIITGRYYGNSRVVLAMQGNPNYSDNFHPIRFSNDMGLTWLDCTFSSALNGTNNFIQSAQCAEGPDNAPLVAWAYNSPPSTFMQIWRGVDSGGTLDWTKVLESATATTNCAGVGIALVSGGAASVLLGISHDCGHAFAPNPCPQECAEIPASRGIVGTSFLDAVPSSNAGFNAGLFLLGLGNPGTVRATVALGRLSTCGHGFMANASDQFCGVN